MRKGVVGLGNLGADMAKRLVRKFPDATLYDGLPAALEPFAGKARFAASLADLGRNADVVGVCVRTDDQVREVIAGTGGLLSTMASGSVIVVHATIPPQSVVDLAAMAAGRGISVIDGAVTRTDFVSDGPFVATMTGGDEAVVDRIRPYLDSFSTDIVHAGPAGAGMLLKICNNLVSLTQNMIAIEAFAIAKAGGVAPEKAAQLMKSNGALTVQMEYIVKMGDNWTGTEAEFRHMLETQASNGEKDFALAAKAAAHLGIPAPGAAHGKAHYAAAFMSPLKRR